MRYKIYAIIESDGNPVGTIYGTAMMVIILVSMIPLMFKGTTPVFDAINTATTGCFIVDYVLRLTIADIKLRHGKASFFLYPFTPMAVIDLLAILPFFTPLVNGFRLVKLLRLVRTVRVFRSFKLFRYAKSARTIFEVINRQRAPLLTVCSMAIGYILISALVLFNVEPGTFDNFFEAMYWATISLTTMGYGDIYPVTSIGRFFTMISALIGIAVVALPASIITAGYMELMEETKEISETAETDAGKE